MYLHHPASDAQNHQCFYFCGAGRTCVCTPACGLTVWWIVQGSGETLGEDSNTHTHSLTHTHTHTHHHHQTRTHTQHTLGGRRRTKVSGASSSLISALLSVRGRRQKKFPIGEEEERKRRGVSTRRAALRFCSGSGRYSSISWFSTLVLVLRAARLRGIPSFSAGSPSAQTGSQQALCWQTVHNKGDREEDELDQGGPKGARNSPGRLGSDPACAAEHLILECGSCVHRRPPVIISITAFNSSCVWF